MSGEEIAVIAGGIATLGGMLVAAVALRPRGLEALYVALPIALGAALVVAVWAGL